jgi:hypothetical protein
MNTLKHPGELTQWLQKDISDNELIFDRCVYIFDIIVQKLQKHNLHLGVDNEVLMIKLCKFLYENSYK